jgi:hypothetical protein
MYTKRILSSYPNYARLILPVNTRSTFDIDRSVGGIHRQPRRTMRGKGVEH